ncbi:hypothetical protein, partial [Aeromonas veronii]|uniref:hypothetical protein n=1 Tax=Aeromonas veronii TaxID=654 RepID=UPI0038B59FD1
PFALCRPFPTPLANPSDPEGRFKRIVIAPSRRTFFSAHSAKCLFLFPLKFLPQHKIRFLWVVYAISIR